MFQTTIPICKTCETRPAGGGTEECLICRMQHAPNAVRQGMHRFHLRAAAAFEKTGNTANAAQARNLAERTR